MDDKKIGNITFSWGSFLPGTPEKVAKEQQVNNRKGKVMTIDPNIISNEELEELLGPGTPVEVADVVNNSQQLTDNTEVAVSEVEGEDLNSQQLAKEEVSNEVTDELAEEVTDEVKDERVEWFTRMDKWYVGKPEPMSYEKLCELADDPMPSDIEDRIRLLEKEYPDHGETYDEEKKALKNQLHFGLAHTWYCAGDGSRKKENCYLNRAAMYDGDHVGKNVRELLKKILTDEFIKENGIIFAHISPSGDGFHLLFDLKKGETIFQGQQRMAKTLGMEKEFDSGVYEENRGFFIVSRKNWVYINPDKFYFKNREEAMAAAEEGRRVMNQKLDGSPLFNGNSNGIGNGNQTSNPNYQPNQNFKNTSTPNNNARACEDGEYPTTYNGAPIKKIVDNLVEKMGGVPEKGHRHDIYGRLITQMRPVCDNDPEWLFSILPGWKDVKERYKQCVDYCNYNYDGKISPFLADAIKMAKNEKKREDNDVTTMGLPPLNRIQKIIMKHVPEEQQQALCVTYNVPVGGLLSGIEADYVDNKTHHLNFGAITVGPPSAGKAYCDVTFEEILQPVQEQDDINWKIKKEYDDKVKRTRKTKDLDVRPVAPVRITPFNIYAAGLKQAMEECDGKHLIMFDSEVGTVVGYDRATGGFIKRALQAAYNNEKMGQRRVGENSVNAKCRSFIQYHMAGVPDAVFEDWITDKDIREGLASRVMLATIADTDEIPYYEKYTDKEKRELYQISTELMAQQGMVYCPYLNDAIRGWIERNKKAEINKYEYGKQFFRRSAVSAWRGAVCWAVIEGIAFRSPKSKSKGTQKEKDCVAYMLWLADYLLMQFTRFFLGRAKEITRKSYSKYGNVMPQTTYKKYGPDDLLADMPDVFTSKEMDAMMAEKKYTDKDKIQNSRYQPIKRFKEDGKIVETGKQKYQKTSSLSDVNSTRLKTLNPMTVNK